MKSLKPNYYSLLSKKISKKYIFFALDLLEQVREFDKEQEVYRIQRYNFVFS